LTDSAGSIRIFVMKELIKTLKRFGLSENEIVIYREILKHDEVSPYVYDVMMELSLKGLIKLEQSDGFTKQQTRIRANNPSVLRTLLQKKRRDLASLEFDLLNFLPELKEDFHKDKVNADFQFFPGIEGAYKVYFDKMEAESNLPVFVWNLELPMDIFGRKEMNKLVQQEIEMRKKSKYPIKELMPLNDWTKHVLTYQTGINPLYVSTWEMRYIDKPSFELNQRISIVGDWIRMICAKDEEVWGLKVHSQMLAQSLKSIFLLTWELGVPITLDVVKSWGVNEFAEFEQREKKIMKPKKFNPSDA